MTRRPSILCDSLTFGQTSSKWNNHMKQSDHYTSLQIQNNMGIKSMMINLQYYVQYCIQHFSKTMTFLYFSTWLRSGWPGGGPPRTGGTYGAPGQTRRVKNAGNGSQHRQNERIYENRSNTPAPSSPYLLDPGYGVIEFYCIGCYVIARCC